MPNTHENNRRCNFESALKRRSTMTPSNFLMKKLGITRKTALDRLDRPEELRLRELIALNFTADEIRGLM